MISFTLFLIWIVYYEIKEAQPFDLESKVCNSELLKVNKGH